MRGRRHVREKGLGKSKHIGENNHRLTLTLESLCIFFTMYLCVPHYSDSILRTAFILL